jgi:ubiquinone/menaquinone biosynthesis C-methylase UbiE
MRHRKLWFAAATAASMGYAAHRASLGDVRGAEAVQGLYDRLAPVYDVGAWIFRPLGAHHLQKQAVELLDLRPGDTVVDLGCGTGVNLSVLADAVGEHGQVVGVDLSQGMLDQARRRADRHHLPQVTLIHGDIREVPLPPGTAAVLATASLEMIPEQDALISNLNAQLSATQGRLAVGGFRRPPDWPEWAVALGRTALALFGVTRAYEDIQPWKSVREHMDEIGFETTLGGALYLIVARASPPRGEANVVRLDELPL